MFPATFEMILSLIGPALNETNTTIGRKPISAEKQLYIALWFMATPDSYRYVKSHLYTLFVFCMRVTTTIVTLFVTVISFFIMWLIVDPFALNLEWAMQRLLEP